MASRLGPEFGRSDNLPLQFPLCPNADLCWCYACSKTRATALKNAYVQKEQDRCAKNPNFPFTCGKAMEKRAEANQPFPLCPSDTCWCYECSMKYVHAQRYENDVYWDEGGYEAQALENALASEQAYFAAKTT